MITLFGNKLIKSISFSQDEIFNDILELHVPKKVIDLDPTYSTGNFYKKIPQPRLKFDINPQTPDTVKADCRNLPLENDSIECINFDPPFLIGLDKTQSESGAITKRFTAFKNIKELYSLYSQSLIEFYRILEGNGVLIFKCQDTVSSGKQYLIHNWLINQAESLGFYTKDLFILLAKNRIIGEKHHTQQHTRKFHSYFLVFKKTKP